VLRESVGNRLPEAVLKHRKWGFAVPWATYFRKDPQLRELVEALPDMDPICNGPLDRTKLRTTIREFLKGDGSHEAMIRQFMMIAVWHQACFNPTTVGKESALRAAS
jgi:hypothetical protein